MRHTLASLGRRLAIASAALTVASFASLAHAAKTELLVYSALEADQIKAYKSGFEKAHPEIELKFVRDSTGIITARLLAEKANPQADVIWGVAATSLMLLDKQGMLQPYAPKGLDKVRANMRDPRAQPTWVGMDLWSSAICFNTVEAGKRKLPVPASWADLVRPEFKGTITMPHPASSGTGYLMVAAWLQIMGEDKGWAYMDGLHQNMGVYTHSGSKPCRQAGAGEFPVGLSFEYRASKTKKDGAPIDIVFPGKAWAGMWRPRPSSRPARSRKPPRPWPTGPSRPRPTSSTPPTSPCWPCPRRRKSWSSFLPTSKSGWRRTTSIGPRPTASASWPSGAAATKPRQRKSKPEPRHAAHRPYRQALPRAAGAARH